MKNTTTNYIKSVERQRVDEKMDKENVIREFHINTILKPQELNGLKISFIKQVALKYNLYEVFDMKKADVTVEVKFLELGESYYDKLLHIVKNSNKKSAAQRGN